MEKSNPLAICAIVMAALGLYAYSLIPERTKVEHLFWEIPLGATEGDVLFMKGEPTQRGQESWQYISNDDQGNWKQVYHVNFKGGKVWSVAFFSADSYDWREQIQNINIGDGDDTVREKFGIPSLITNSHDGLERIYHYPKYNIIFGLARNRVTAIGIYSAELAPKGVEFITEKDKLPHGKRK